MVLGYDSGRSDCVTTLADRDYNSISVLDHWNRDRNSSSTLDDGYSNRDNNSISILDL